MQNGAQVWTTKVVTGKPGVHATPLLTETMKYITVNPTWNVPPSIVYGEYLPALQQDPTVLERMGLRLEHERDGSIHISQPPGGGNALGRVRFNFPNTFLVYQKDTPEKIRAMYGHSEVDLKFPTPIPVNITYQTAFVDDAGKLEFRKDIYGRDAEMISMLRNPRGKDMENYIARAQPSIPRPAGSSLPPGVNFASDNTSYS